MSESNEKEIHIAPMLHVSTLEFRLLMRILSKRCVLWTEMVVDETLYYNCHPTSNNPTREVVPLHLLDPVHEDEGDDNNYRQKHPIVCQIGGIRPEWTALATRLVVRNAGYHREVNLNLDCPSSRVQGKRFGAVLMRDLETTIALLTVMQEESFPETLTSVKCRIGIVEDETDWDWIVQWIERVSHVCTRFVLHARPVVLYGLLSPAQNRSVPPLNYPWIYRLCQQFPHCTFVINGGIPNLQAARHICYGTLQKRPQEHTSSSSELESSFRARESPQSCNQYFDTTPTSDNHNNQSHQVPCSTCSVSNGSCIAPPLIAPTNLVGCMLGRAAMDHPVQFWDVDRYWYNDMNSVATRRQILDQYCTDVLERLYPRRCCDDDPTVTDRLPAPTTTRNQGDCSICSNGVNPISTTTAAGEQPAAAGSAIKISIRVMDRSLKPVLNLFFRQNGSKAFRRACERLSRDATIRNCGPAYCLRLAVAQTIDPSVLDASLVRTEESIPY